MNPVCWRGASIASLSPPFQKAEVPFHPLTRKWRSCLSLRGQSVPGLGGQKHTCGSVSYSIGPKWGRSCHYRPLNTGGAGRWGTRRVRGQGWGPTRAPAPPGNRCCPCALFSERPPSHAWSTPFPGFALHNVTRVIKDPEIRPGPAGDISGHSALHS